MRVDLYEGIDGVQYHAQVESLEDAEKFLDFLDVKRGKAPIFAPGTPTNARAFGYSEPTTTAGNVVAAQQPTRTVTLVPIDQPGGYVAHVEAPPKWTRENLQPVVVTLAKQRDKFVGLLEKFGVARFRDLPDDKLDAFGRECEAVQQLSAVAA